MSESVAEQGKKCCLCGKSGGYLIRFERWSEEEKEYALSHLNTPPPPNSMTCKRDKLEAKRYCHTHEHIPRWKSTSSTNNPTRKCIHPKCTASSEHTKIVQTTLAKDRVQQCLNIETLPEGPYNLCKKHYSEVYRQVKPSCCSSCGATPKPGTYFYRPSPDANHVSKVLSEIMDTTINLKPTDTICYRCYKVHLSIMKDIKSSDDALQQDIQTWTETYNNAATDKLTKSLIRVVIVVADHLLHQRAVLLPHMSRIFLEAYGILDTGTVSLEVGDSVVNFSSRWLLQQLIVYLHAYMSFKCEHKKFGTVLFRKGGDLFVSLSWALGNPSFSSRFQEKTTLSTCSSSCTKQRKSDTVIEEAGDIINDLLHEELRKSAEPNNTSDPAALNITEQFSNLNPLLTKFIKLATRTVRERHNPTLESDSSTAKHTKFTRQYFILLQLMYCINCNRPSLLHTILTDVVEVCGGSRVLLKILNRLGCVSSTDSHDRFVTERAEDNRALQIWDQLPSEIFTIASVDNFDMLQSHAAVYTGNQQRSYHGTTVQLVQPISTLKLDTGTTPTEVLFPSSLQTDNSQSLSTTPTTYLINDTCSSQSIPTMLEEAQLILLQDMETAPPVDGSENNNASTSITSESSNHAPISTVSSSTEASVLTDLRNIQPVATEAPTPRSIVIGRTRHRHSPASSPHKLGKTGPKRRRTVSARKLATIKNKKQPQQQQQQQHQQQTETSRHMLNLSSFTENNKEKQALTNLMTKLHAYNMQAYAAEHINLTLSEFRTWLHDTQSQPVIPSRMHYMELIDENPDTDETMMLVAEDLLEKFGAEYHEGWVVLVGDGKTYQHLMQIKQEYGAPLDKLFIFPGDWHTLKNYQETLMHVYYSAGLQEIAKETGYHGKTLSSLESCTNFKRTHNFLLQVWEALYREIIKAFCMQHQNPGLTETVQCILSAAVAESKPSHEVLNRTLALLEDSRSFSQLHQFITHQSDIDDTWKFWTKFVFLDCFAYIALYLAIRGSNWQLRLASLKLMAPLFSAFDRNLYQRIIPNHLADIHQYPKEILQCFQAGGFTVSINGKQWHSVALDEAHEMCINKDLKLATIHPTPSYLQKTTLFFNYRITAYKHFLKQLFPEKVNQTTSENSTIVTDNTTAAGKREENIKCMCAVIHNSSLFSIQTANRGLINCFTGQKATPEQTHDMMNFRSIGAESFHNFVAYRILKTPSTSSAPVRRKQLLTMKKTKLTKRHSQKEKEAKLVTKCLRRRLAWCNKTHEPIDLSTEQYSIYPRALADEYGNPHKASKSSWTDKIRSRYLSAIPPVILPYLSTGWVPETVLIDAMFLVNTTPLRRTKNITDYSHLLFNRYALDHYKTGVKEVHFIFDKPNKQSFNPKLFEQGRRDATSSKNQHQHQNFTPTTNIPQNWRQYIQCRQCQRSIIEAIGLAYLQKGGQLLRNGQSFVIAGGDGEENAWIILPNTVRITIPQPSLQFKSNASEADFRIWRHAFQCNSSRILIHSPDTDVYNIGLSLTELAETEYIVQLNVPHAQDKRFINLNNFIAALSSDPDLASIQKDQLAKTLQILFLCTGCDYNSYFKSLGKATFWNVFFQHATFITGSHMPGHLHETDITSRSNGFLAFVRLVGTAYFKKYAATFLSVYNFKTPSHHFNSLKTTQCQSPLSIEDQHKAWFKQLRTVVAERIVTEEERVPSYTSLWRHWLRTCWCAQLWGSSLLEDMYGNLLPPESCGWVKNSDGTHSIDWEDPDVQKKIQGTIDFLVKGCTCKKGCKNNRCKCRKKNDYCGPGCECQGCINIPVQQPEAASDTDSDSEDSSSTGSYDGESGSEEEVETEVVTMEELLVFDQIDTV